MRADSQRLPAPHSRETLRGPTRIHYQAKEVCRHAHKLSSLVKEVRERAALPFLWCRKGVKAVFILWARCGHPNCSASNT